MPVELRKRKAPAVAPAAPPPSKKKTDVTKASGAKDTGKKGAKAATNGATAPAKVAVGDVIALDGFGGEVETQDGEKTTLKKLVDDSKSGVVLFTYPKASTPGCKNIGGAVGHIVLADNNDQAPHKPVCSATPTLH